MLKCRECGCISETGRGWFASILEEPEADDGRVVATYCPPCSARVLGSDPRVTRYL